MFSNAIFQTSARKIYSNNQMYTFDWLSNMFCCIPKQSDPLQRYAGSHTHPKLPYVLLQVEVPLQSCVSVKHSSQSLTKNTANKWLVFEEQLRVIIRNVRPDKREAKCRISVFKQNYWLSCALLRSISLVSLGIQCSPGKNISARLVGL